MADAGRSLAELGDERAPGAAAFHLGPSHRIVHGNGAFLERYGAGAVGQPAREAMTDLPREAFALLDVVLREGRPLARTLRLDGGPVRLVVVPRRDPDDPTPYGVTTHLRSVEVRTPG